MIQNLPLNEVARIVVDLSSLVASAPEVMTYPYDRDSRLFIAGDGDGAGGIRWTQVGSVEWQYRLMGELCEHRAVEAEFGRLLVDGRRIPAERYIALWRECCRKPTPLDQLLARGITPVMEFTLLTDACLKESKADAWFASPYLVSRGEYSVWSVPLTAAESFALAAQLGSVYWRGTDESIPRRRNYLQVNASPQVPETSAVRDLFAEALA